MKRSELIGRLIQCFGEMDVLYPNGYGYEELAEHILHKWDKEDQQSEARAAMQGFRGLDEEND